jgi:hypothetical protein
MVSTRVQGVLGMIRLLRSNKIIDPQTSGLLDDLRAIGNQAAHNPQASYTKADALRFKDLADQVISQLEFMTGFHAK